MFPLVESWIKSGLTQKHFCSNQGMPVHILAYWVGRYHKAQPTKATADKKEVTTGKSSKKVIATQSDSGFIRLRPPSILSPAPTVASSQLPTGSVEVVLPIGAIIRFSATVPAGYLKELLSLCSH
jgi:hypothetical protein